MNDMRKLMESIDEAYFGKQEGPSNSGEMSMDEIVEIGKQHGIDEDGMWKAVVFAHDNDLFWEMEIEVHNSEGKPVGRYPTLTDIPTFVKDPETGEEVETTVDNLYVIYKTTPEQVTDMIGWFKENEAKIDQEKQQIKRDASFGDWLDQNPFESVNESYHSRLAAAADDIAYYNKRMPDDELIELIRTQLGDMAAQYIADKLAGGETDWKENLRKTLDNMDKPNYSWSNRIEEDNYRTAPGGGPLRKLGSKTLARKLVPGLGKREADQRAEDAFAAGRMYRDAEYLSSTGEAPEYEMSPEDAIDKKRAFKQMDRYAKIAQGKKPFSDTDLNEEGVDEGVSDWLKRLDKKAAGWITKKADTMIAKQVAELVRKEGINGAMVSVRYLSGGGGKTIKSSLESYLKHSSDGEYAEAVRYVLPALDKDEKSMRDAEISAFGAPLGEENSDFYQRPYENEKEWMGKKVVITSCRDKSLEGKWGVVVDIDKYRNEEGEWQMKYVIDTPEDDGMHITLYPSEWSYDQIELVKDADPMSDFMLQNPFESLEEAKGKIVQVPAGLRGEGHNKTGKATSDDAEEFIKELGIDDQIDTDVVDPETGELLFTTGTTKRKESKKGNYQVLNYDDFTRGAKLREPESPVMHSGWDWENDIEKKQDNAWELLRELRDSDFYNVVWKNATELVGKPDMGTDDEEWADLDYDVDVEIPVAIKRKDGKRFTEDDHDNFREIVSAVKKASTMGNFGIQYAGTSNKGTVARFVPSFM